MSRQQLAQSGLRFLVRSAMRREFFTMADTESTEMREL